MVEAAAEFKHRTPHWRSCSQMILLRMTVKSQRFFRFLEMRWQLGRLTCRTRRSSLVRRKKKGLESQTSPALKGTKVVAEEEAKVTAATDGVIGPGRTTVRNLKGDGDVDGGCWHILLYSRMRSGMAMSRRFLALLTPRPNRVKPRWQLT